MTAEYTELRPVQNVRVEGLDGVREIMFPQDRRDQIDLQNISIMQREVKVPALLRSVGVPFERDPKQVMDLSPRTAEGFQNVGKLLLDLARLKPHIVLPASGDEMQNFAKNALVASITDQPLELVTPCCPDWSQDSSGRYDYQALNGGPSFIAEKFFQESPSVLKAFHESRIPFNGTIIIADWGLENEIEAFDHEGRLLASEEVQERFYSTATHAEGSLARLKMNDATTHLYTNFRVMLMTEFFEERDFDADGTYQEARGLFLQSSRGQKLVGELHRASMPINAARRGLTEDQNLAQAIQSVSEYATFSASLQDNSVLFAAESQTTSKAYNTHRQQKVPLLFLNGRSQQARAVNIL